MQFVKSTILARKGILAVVEQTVTSVKKSIEVDICVPGIWDKIPSPRVRWWSSDDIFPRVQSVFSAFPAKVLKESVQHKNLSCKLSMLSSREAS